MYICFCGTGACPMLPIIPAAAFFFAQLGQIIVAQIELAQQHKCRAEALRQFSQLVLAQRQLPQAAQRGETSR